MEQKVYKLLSGHLGLEPEDISEDDSFRDDLNMSSTQLSDFVHILEENEIDMGNIKISEVETVGELIEMLDPDEFIS